MISESLFMFTPAHTRQGVYVCGCPYVCVNVYRHTAHSNALENARLPQGSEIPLKGLAGCAISISFPRKSPLPTQDPAVCGTSVKPGMAETQSCTPAAPHMDLTVSLASQRVSVNVVIPRGACK